MEFRFGSGPVVWDRGTNIYIGSDGGFSGYYHDSDMNDTGDGYPNGTEYVCSFNGKFTALEKTGDFEYSMTCESVQPVEAMYTNGTVGDIEIVDGVRIITTVPYGFDSADEFKLYLPGKNIDELPEAFLNWVRPAFFSIAGSVTGLPFYGLYNVSGQEGFSGVTDTHG